MQGLFNSNAFMPHGMCLLWRTDIVALHVLADGLIALAYFSIPVALAAFVRRRPMLRHRGVVLMFAAFILMCGATHLVAIWTLWHADYALQGLVKAATAVISIATAVSLWRLMPSLLALPTPSELGLANERLAVELEQRALAEQRYRELVNELEEVVEERTQRLNQSLQALAISERRFRGAFDTASHGRALVGLDGLWVEVNPALCEMLGYSAEELLRTHWRGVTHPEDIDKTDDQAQLIQAGEIDAYSLEKRYIAKDGHVVHALIDVRVVRDDTGQPLCFVTDIRDRTQQVELEEAYRHAEARATAIIETASDAIFELDGEGIVVAANPAAQTLLGVDAATLPGRAIGSLVCHADGGPVPWSVLRESGQARDAAGTPTHELFVHLGEAAPVPVELRIGGASEGDEARYSVIVHDISERYATAQALREAHDQMRFHMANSPLAVIEWDCEFRVAYWSPAAERIFGWSAAEIIGRSPAEWRFVHEDDAEEVNAIIADLAAGRLERNQTHNRNYRKDGSAVDAEWWNSVRVNDAGEVISILSFVEDISDAVASSRALERSEAHTKAILDTAVDGIISIEPDGTVLSFNPAAERIFGYQPEEVVGRNVSMLMPAPYRNQHDGYLAHFIETGERRVIGNGREVTGLRRNGEEFPMELAVSEVNLKGHRTFTGFVRDISERKHFEREIVEGNRRLQEQDWLLSGHAGLAKLLQGNLSVDQIGERALEFLCHYVGAQAGAFHRYDEEAGLQSIASYGCAPQSSAAPVSSLAIQAARDKRPLTLGGPTLSSSLNLTTGFGEIALRHVIAFPVVRESRVEAVVELAGIDVLHASHRDFLVFVSDQLAVALLSARDHQRVNELLHASREQAATLERQREELRTVNAHLRDRGRSLEQRNRELRAAKREIEDKAHAVEQANLYKSEFLANMSHELRTPLNSMLVLSRSLADNRDGTLSDDDVECARVIHGSGENLLALINDILDLSKVEAGKLDINLALAAPADLVRELQSQFEPIAESRGLEFSVESDAGLDLLATDPLRLLQILRNLLGNAFKFTEAGGVTLTVSADGAERIRFQVADTGIGISADDRARIFEAFQQADGTTRRYHEGTGLGLSICRELGRLLHATLEVESEVGFGSCFTLSVPRRHPDFEHAAPLALPAPAPLAAPHGSSDLLAETRILVVDDDHRNSFALSRVLGACGATVRIADSGRSALDRLGEEPFDLVLMDIMMPGMNGCDTMRAMRADPRLAEIPVVAVTANVSPETRDDATAAGACACVSKPVDSEQLLELLSARLGRAA